VARSFWNASQLTLQKFFGEFGGALVRSRSILETAIGNLGQEICQDRDIYANLTQRAILHAQVNSFRARFPRIQVEVHRGASSCAREFEDCPGYALLPHHENHPTPLLEDELDTFLAYWCEQGWPIQEAWTNRVCRWAKLQLPNGQKACSTWHESNIVMKFRCRSCVEVNFRDMFLVSIS
jgi:hypothetical protein